MGFAMAVALKVAKACMPPTAAAHASQLAGVTSLLQAFACAAGLLQSRGEGVSQAAELSAQLGSVATSLTETSSQLQQLGQPLLDMMMRQDRHASLDSAGVILCAEPHLWHSSLLY